jgi:hypothetical protein
MLTRYVTVAYSSKQRFILEQRAVVIMMPSLAELELDLADAVINLLFKSQIMKTYVELRRLVCAFVNLRKAY